MNKRVYRPSRVRVSVDIENAIFKLVEQEQDVNKKKKHPAWWYRDEVAKLLKLKESNNPSIRSYEEILRKIRKKLRYKDPLDNPWCIGHCMEHGISGNVIPLLVRIKRKIGERLTIRRAKWVSLLYPAIEELVNEQYPEDPHQQEIRYIFISREYALRERLCSTLKRDFDTTDFDTLFFTYRDISEEALFDATGDNLFFRRPKSELGEFSPDDVMELKTKLGDLTERELDLINSFGKALAHGRVNACIYIHEHSEEMQPLIDRIQKAGSNKGNDRNKDQS